MSTPFVKMHGCGNDFVVLDARAAPFDVSPARAAALADRHTGIGCDQLIVLEPGEQDAGAFMRIRNPDGTEAGACGNATRCVAALIAPGARVVIRTIAGDLAAEPLPDGRVRVDMGEPRLGWRDVPLSREVDTRRLPLPGAPAALSIGNPHATLFGPEPDDAALAAAGSALERDPLFAERANVGFATVLAPGRIRLRMWERSAGITRACGSGACAALVNAARLGLAGRRAVVVLDGGELEVEWRDDGRVLMAGPVATAFTGSVDLSAYPA